MLLDPKTVPIGTTGFIPPLSCDEFGDDDKFKWYSERADVVLCDDREWHSLISGKTCPADVVYDDWREAVRHTIDEEHKGAVEMLDEAIALLRQSNRVSNWLAESK